VGQQRSLGSADAQFLCATELGDPLDVRGDEIEVELAGHRHDAADDLVVGAAEPFDQCTVELQRVER
jgi:hypothetical protein